ncbi:hypothetical protein [Bradyrhizobium neotropicale]|nr:hypothetical protein [Bradyrhizobium neotropicale]
MKVDWTTDSSGQMLGFSYHDAGLIALEWEDTRYFRMKLATVDGGVSRVELCDLDEVTLQDVWNGMIVSDIFAWPVTSVPGDRPWHDLLTGRAHKPDIPSAAVEIMERKPSALLVNVLSSYGGTFAAVCGSINVWTENALP